MYSIVRFLILVAASWLIVWIADGDPIHAVIVYALLDIGAGTRS